MAARDNYRAQVELLIRCLPAVASEPDFALKGGTAINLFLRDMPRLSVDIDLTYLPVSERDAALADIRARLATIAEAIQRSVPGAKVRLVEGDAPKLLVDKSSARIKVEPSVVIRGSLVPLISSELCLAAQEAYELFVEIQRLDLPDLYAGKLCAALDRQHPRDWFDCLLLRRNEGLTTDIRQTFVAYVAAHNRPINEILTRCSATRRRRRGVSLRRWGGR